MLDVPAQRALRHIPDRPGGIRRRPTQLGVAAQARELLAQPSMAGARQTLSLNTLEHVRIGRPFDLEISGRALFQPPQAMVDENI